MRLLPADFPSRGAAKRAAKRGLLRIDGEACEASTTVAAGQTVQYVNMGQRHAPLASAAPQLRLQLLYEDDWMAAVLKPPGISVCGDGDKALQQAVGALLPPPASRPDALPRPQYAHRLDRATGGVLLYARCSSAAAALGTAFASGGRVRKKYLALVVGRLEGEGVVDQPMQGGKPARSHWRAVRHTRSAVSGWLTTVELAPHTGRRHQLRRHLEFLGHPILGDSCYGGADTRANAAPPVPMHLWATQVELEHPYSGAPLLIEAPPPAHFDETRAREEAEADAAPQQWERTAAAAAVRVERRREHALRARAVVAVADEAAAGSDEGG
mgnify:CR=1 FL=1